MTTKTTNNNTAPNAEQLKAIETTFKNCLRTGTNNPQELGEVLKAISAEIDNRKETARDYADIAHEEVKQHEAGNHEGAKKIAEEWREEVNRDQSNALIQKVLINNYKYLMQAEGLKYIADIISKYNNKPHGQKTADKISAELHELAQAWGLDYLYIGNLSVNYRLTNKGARYSMGNYPIYTDVKIYARNDSPIIDNDNRIKAEALQKMQTGGALPVYDIAEHIRAGYEAIADYNGAQRVADEKRERIAKYYPVFNSLINR